MAKSKVLYLTDDYSVVSAIEPLDHLALHKSEDALQHRSACFLSTALHAHEFFAAGFRCKSLGYFLLLFCKDVDGEDGS